MSVWLTRSESMILSILIMKRSWCEYLHSVEYIGIADDNGCAVNDNDSNKDCTPLRKSKWTVGVKGLRFR